MPLRRSRTKVLIAAGTALLLAPLSLGGLPSAVAAPVKATRPLTVPQPSYQLKNDKLKGTLARPSAKRQAVFVQLKGSGAAAVSQAVLGDSTKASTEKAARNAALARRTSVTRTANKVLAAARKSDSSTTKLFSVSNAVPGVALVANHKTLAALAKRSDVVSIAALVPKKANNASVSQLTRAVNTWKNPGVTGRGVTIGIIDTGIDYTHADFGGAGTVEAYDAAKADQTSFTPNAKVVGGTDFVGDDYDADSTADTYQPLPKPDPNPLDCNEHGTHVAGTAAGYGVNADGSTFRGSYAGLNRSSLYDLRIGPGMAPQASLYALKVFGCTGSTDAVIPALDWALDPNGDGDFADHLDIVNLSLGGDYAPADDPENAVVNTVAKHGVLPVISAGNAGDLTDVSGSPGNAVRALTVASSIDELQLRDGIRVDAPSGLAGIAASQFSVAYDWATEPPVTGSVVSLSSANADGCDPLGRADAATVTGKVAWLEWDDDDAARRCGSAVRSNNVAAAGAIGAIFTSGLDVFNAAITGSEDIPVVQLPKAETDRLRPAATAGTLNVTFDGSLQGTIKSTTPAITDTLSSFSSRGVHGTSGVVKPDVTAPGDTVTSAGFGTGNESLTISGTSMAAPVTAGTAALVVKQHPTWTATQVKAAVMNTAGHDLYTEPDRKGDRYGPARVGAGRVDAYYAVKTNVLAYALGKGGAVSASFGVVEAPADKKTVTRTRTIRIRNTSNRKTTAKIAYDAVVKQPGVSYKVSRSSVTLKARSYVDVKLRLTATSAKLRHTIDPTMDTQQTDAFLVDGDGNTVQRARQYLSDASGHLLVTPAGHSALRVPVYGAAKPVSETRVDNGTAAGGPALLVKGAGFAQGSGSTAYESKLSVMTLGAVSPRQPVCPGTIAPGCTGNTSARAGDLHYVGAGAMAGVDGDRANGFLWFGLSTWANSSNIGTYNTPVVDIDTTGDGRPDFEAYVQPEAGTDLLTTFVVDLATGDLVDLQPANFLDGDVETNVFDTNAVLLPVTPAALGMTNEDTTFPITYTVSTFNYYAPDSTGNIQDTTAAIPFDVANPAVAVDGPLYPDTSGVAIPYQVSSSARAGAKALVLHLHGRTGTKAETQTLTQSPG